MWILHKAIMTIRKLQPDVREMGYHITLGGGVLNVGFSKKDLDLYVLRMNDTPLLDSYKVVEGVHSLLEKSEGEKLRLEALRDGADYGPDVLFHYEQAFKITWPDGRRIDLFVQ